MSVNGVNSSFRLSTAQVLQLLKGASDDQTGAQSADASAAVPAAPQTQTGPATQATPAIADRQNSPVEIVSQIAIALAALLSGHATQAAPTPSGQGGPQGGNGDAAASYAVDVLSLLQSADSGDTAKAQDAAIPLQALLDNVTASIASDVTASPTEPASAFISNLENLLIAVQSGDTNAARTAADTLIASLPTAPGQASAAPSSPNARSGVGGQELLRVIAQYAQS